MKYLILPLLLLAAFFCDAQTRTGRDFAVFFTVSNYDNPDLWPNLPQIPGEISAIGQLLRTDYNFNVEIIANATSTDIKNTLELYNNESLYGSDSQLLLFFSMHGQRTVQGQGYLIPKDGKNTPSSWLAHTQLKDIIDMLPCPRILVSVDACYSGTFDYTRHKPGAAVWEIGNLDCGVKRKLAFENKMPARKYLTSGRSDQRVPGQSKFAQRWQNALASKGSEDGILSFTELWSFLNQYDNSGIVPTSGGFGRDKEGDFVFICKPCCETAPSPKLIEDDLILVKGGSYLMGCTSEQKDCYGDESPAHQVSIPNFYIGKYEVTQRLWREIMGSDPPELTFKGCDQCPVEGVSWEDVQEFLLKLNTKYPGQNYRLPTEAEWEYAAREGGKPVLFGNGKNVLNPLEANFNNKNLTASSIDGIDRSKTTPVGSFAPNALGLYDMSGNVWEWCRDWYGLDYYKYGPAIYPIGPPSGTYRVVRGGSWDSYPINCRTSVRFSNAPGNRSNVGFRLARTP